MEQSQAVYFARVVWRKLDPGAINSPEGLERWAREKVQAARSLFERDRDLCPICFLVTSKGPKADRGCGELAVPLDFSGEQEKAMADLLIRGAIKDTEAVAVLIMFESWMLMDCEPDEYERWAGRIEEHPKAVKTIWTSFETRRGRKASWYIEIEAGEKKLNLGEICEAKPVGGRFANWFPPAN